jgi:hypothetical protein
VANADIFVGAAGLVRLIEDDAVHRKARRLQGSSSPNEQEDWLGGRVFALLRWEWEWPEQAGDESSSHAPFSHGSNLTPTQEPPQSQTSDSGATDSPTNAATGAPWSPIFAQGSKAYLLPRADSQDAWLFRSPLPPRAAQAVANSGSNFWLGVPRCDNRLAEVSGSYDKKKVESRSGDSGCVWNDVLLNQLTYHPVLNTYCHFFFLSRNIQKMNPLYAFLHFDAPQFFAFVDESISPAFGWMVAGVSRGRRPCRLEPSVGTARVSRASAKQQRL